MTSVNAMKFDDYSGIMVCDEARCWGPDKMTFYTSEKVRPIISSEIQRDLGIIVCQSFPQAPLLIGREPADRAPSSLSQLSDA